MTQKDDDGLLEVLYKCKDAFSLRDEIGRCPDSVPCHIEDKIDMCMNAYLLLCENNLLYAVSACGYIHMCGIP